MVQKITKQLQQWKVISRRVCLLSRKPTDGNGKKTPKASSSKNVRRVKEQVTENPEFLDDLAMNSDENANDDAAEGPPMGTGNTSRFNISHEQLH